MGALQVNAALVKRGYAWAVSRGNDASLRALQREAQRARRGVWQDANPTPPWVWRRAQPVPAY